MEEEEGEEEQGPPAFSTSLVAPPCYPNAVRWSDDNLIAVATSQLINILNPASIEGPRGFVAVSSSPPFDIGRVRPADLRAPCLLPICLSRDVSAGVRSMDWSPQGLAPNGGCLLAICTKDHRVKLYRAPYCEFQSEWIEVLDLSELLYSYSCHNRFIETDQAAPTPSDIEPSFQGDVILPAGSWSCKGKRSGRSCKEPEHRKAQKSREELLEEGLDVGSSGPLIAVGISGLKSSVAVEPKRTTESSNATDARQVFIMKDSSALVNQNQQAGPGVVFQGTSPDLNCVMGQKQSSSQAPEPTMCPELLSSRVSVSKSCKVAVDEAQNSYISSSLYTSRSNMLAYLVVSWSSKLMAECPMDGLSISKAENFVLIALGAKSGEVSVLRAVYPQHYTVEKVSSKPEVSFVGILGAHGSWVTTLCWGKGYKNIYNKDGIAEGQKEEIFLVTGSCDGSVKLWSGDAQAFAHAPSNSGNVPLSLIRKVVFEDSMPVTSIALAVPTQSFNHVLLAVGKGSGSLSAFEFKMSGKYCREACQIQAHSQVVTGIVWAFDGHCLYTCSQDNRLRAWVFSGNQLMALPFPKGSALVDSEPSDTSSDLPSSVLDCYFGLDLSKGSLALATVRGVSTEMVDPMYQSRSLRAVAQIFWVGNQQFTAQPRHLLTTIPNVGCNIFGSNLVQWESNILLALHHFEDTRNTLVLWDVVACLTSLKTVAGIEFLNTVISKWLASWGMDNFWLFTETFQQCLSGSSSRCLHIVSVICRCLYVSGLMPEAVTGKAAMSLECPSSADQSTSLSGCQGKVWQRFLLDVEHELRQRLTYLALRTVVSRVQDCATLGESSKKYDDLIPSGVICMLQWALTNSAKVSSQLLAEAYRASEKLRGCAQPESCSFCHAKVPFVSVEASNCQGSESHQLQRCAVSFGICPSGTLWFCNCCARSASKHAAALFFTLSSGRDIERIPELELAVSCNIAQPLCPFCGILMQRLLPDCFLRLSLI